MRAVLHALVLTLAAASAAAQTTLQLRWRLEADVLQPDGRGAAQVSFTITNRDAKPLAPAGWAIYFNALHEPHPGSVSGGFTIERVTGGLRRLRPGPGFTGLGAGESVAIEYLTGLLTNRSFAPVGPYVVYDAAPEVGHPLEDYVALPFERKPQGEGRDPRAVSPREQYELDSVIRDGRGRPTPTGRVSATRRSRRLSIGRRGRAR